MNVEPNQRFSNDEVTAIIRRALSGKTPDDTIGIEELEEIARQSGISSSALYEAIEKQETEGQMEAAREIWKTKRKRAFKDHLRAYVIVNGFLVVVNLLTGMADFWAIWPMVAWGLGLAFDASDAFFPSEEKVESGARRIVKKQRRAKGIVKPILDDIAEGIGTEIDNVIDRVRKA